MLLIIILETNWVTTDYTILEYKKKLNSSWDKNIQKIAIKYNSNILPNVESLQLLAEEISALLHAESLFFVSHLTLTENCVKHIEHMCNFRKIICFNIFNVFGFIFNNEVKEVINKAISICKFYWWGVQNWVNCFVRIKCLINMKITCPNLILCISISDYWLLLKLISIPVAYRGR